MAGISMNPVGWRLGRRAATGRSAPEGTGSWPPPAGAASGGAAGAGAVVVVEGCGSRVAGRAAKASGAGAWTGAGGSPSIVGDSAWVATRPPTATTAAATPTPHLVRTPDNLATRTGGSCPATAG